MATIVEIEGVGEQFADKLAQAGIGSTQSLLKKGTTRRDRSQIAKAAGVSPKRVLAWVNRADLMRVRGVGEEYADLLEASGVDTVPELSQRRSDHLCESMAQVNERRHLVRRLPAVSEVRRWITAARKLPRIVEY